VDGQREPVESISAVTLLTVDMVAAVSFYQALGFHVLSGGKEGRVELRPPARAEVRTPENGSALPEPAPGRFCTNALSFSTGVHAGQLRSEMANVGDRIAVASKGKPRAGVVTAVGGAMIRVRWDAGGETSLVPGPGVLSVVAGRRSTQSRRTRRPASGAASAVRKKSAAGLRSAVTKKTAPGKKAVAVKKTVRGKPVVRNKAVAVKKTVLTKPVVRKKAVAVKKTVRTKRAARNAAPGKKRVAKPTSSTRRTGKKTR
jgi:hypothetical protein